MTHDRRSQWASHDLGAIDPEIVVGALVTERDVPLAAAMMSAVAEDLDALATLAASGAPLDADILERLVARCRVAAELAAINEAKGSAALEADHHDPA